MAQERPRRDGPPAKKRSITPALTLRQEMSNVRNILGWVLESRVWRIATGIRRSKFRALSVISDLRDREFRVTLAEPTDETLSAGPNLIAGLISAKSPPREMVEVLLDYVTVGNVPIERKKGDVWEFKGTVVIDQAFAGSRDLTIRVRLVSGLVKELSTSIRVLATGADRARRGEDSREALAMTEMRSHLDRISRLELMAFLSSQDRIVFAKTAKPEVSIIIVLYNRSDLTLHCLRSILNQRFTSYEVIIVDNGSSDETHELLERVAGARIILNEENLHFIRAANQAGRVATGRSLLFLNSDARLAPGALQYAADTLQARSDIGAVGGKIILPDGTLQEAGAMLFSDATPLGYGRYDDPLSPQYAFRRDVDYCSGCFLLTQASVFASMGGFDEAFVPAYYEETDYCVKLWKNGLRVVYEPRSVVFHYEFGSSDGGAVAQQQRNHELFASRHREWFADRPPRAAGAAIFARDRVRDGAKRILVLDDTVPHSMLGTGLPRSIELLRSMVDLDHLVTFFPMLGTRESWDHIYEEIPREVEVMSGYDSEMLEDLLIDRDGYYDLIFVSRPHNMRTFREISNRRPGLIDLSNVIYDAEAIFAKRDALKELVLGPPSTGAPIDSLSEELSLTEGVRSVVAVSEAEAEEFRRHGSSSVNVLAYSILPAPTPRPFSEREGFLFIGPLEHPDSPNADSMLWFCKEILPIINESVADPIRLTVIGRVHTEIIDEISGDHVKCLGPVSDLRPYYDTARVFVAPTRFAAGIPLKVPHAAAHGLPVVAIRLLTEQLGWRSTEISVGESPEDFAAKCIELYSNEEKWTQIRAAALARINADGHPDSFREKLENIVG